MDKRGCEGAWEYNLDVEILVLGSIHYYHYMFVFLKLMALGDFNSRCPLTRDYKGSLAGLPPPCGERSREGENSVGPLTYLTEQKAES